MENLGKKVRDKVTGFIGIISGYNKDIGGTEIYTLSPSVDRNGDYRYATTFSKGRVEIIGDGITAKQTKAEENCDVEAAD